MTEFTKGPWVPDWKNPGFLRGIDAADGNPVISAEEYSGSSWISAENLRDIHLIAAAPELYEALNNLVEIAKRYELYEIQTEVERGDVALAKARGEA